MSARDDFDPEAIERRLAARTARTVPADHRDRVLAAVRDTLAEFKVPAYVERWDGKLPRNASGKLLKNVLRGEAPAGFSETM